LSAAATAQRSAGISNPSPVPASPTSDIPKSLAHAFSKVAYYSSFYYPAEDPTALALKKFSASQDRLGNLKLQLDHDVTTKFHEPFINTLSTSIAESSKARRHVQAVRLTYDASRAHAKTSSTDASKKEMEACEDEFVSAVEAAMGKMKAVVGGGDALRCIADLCAAQLAYFKSGFEALSQLSPELDELQVQADAAGRRDR